MQRYPHQILHYLRQYAQNFTASRRRPRYFDGQILQFGYNFNKDRGCCAKKVDNPAHLEYIIIVVVCTINTYRYSRTDTGES